MRISDWSSDVCSSDLDDDARGRIGRDDVEILDLAHQHRAHVGALRCGDRDRDGIDRFGAAVAQPRIDRGGDALRGGEIGAREVEGEPRRSEEHTSELQSLMRISYAVFCLKKKK